MKEESQYGKWLRSKNVTVLSGGLTITKDSTKEGRDENGDRFKATTDEIGNTVVEHNNKKDQVDVHIKAPHIRVGAQEVRD